MNQQSVIDLKKKLDASNSTGIAIDIDGTVSDTSTYWFEQAVKKFGNPTSMTKEEIITKYLVIQNIPFWNKEVVEPWLREARKSYDLHFFPQPILHAREALIEIKEKVGIVAYITARRQFLEDATLSWLKKHNFPQAPVIHMPNDILPKNGDKWKARVLEFLYPSVLGIVDDSPLLIKEISQEYQGKIYLIRSQDKTNFGPRVHPCLNWQEVKKELLF